MNWGALLAANGYQVVMVTTTPVPDEFNFPNVEFLGPDQVGEVDYVLWGSTSTLGSNWFGRSTIAAKRVIRIQWPTGQRVDHSGDVVACVHPCFANQVADECGIGHEQIHILPGPTLPLSWWEMRKKPSAWPVKDSVIWAARDAFIGSQGPCGEAALRTFEETLRLHLIVLSIEQHQPQAQRFANLGAELTSGLHLGDILRAMRRSYVCVTTPAFMGPTLTEAIFEDCAPLVWRSYRALFPELVTAAEKHGVLLDGPDQVRDVLRRLLTDSGLRAAYLDSAKFAFADNSPAKCIEKWRFMEGRLR
jgi:hypothetical protein